MSSIISPFDTSPALARVIMASHVEVIQTTFWVVFFVQTSTFEMHFMCALQ